MDVNVKIFSPINGLQLELQPHEHNDVSKFPRYRFQVGTVTGIIQESLFSLDICLIKNKVKQNGHLEDAIHCLTELSKQGTVDLRVIDIINPKFKQHLIDKYGFRQTRLRDIVSKTYL